MCGLGTVRQEKTTNHLRLPRHEPIIIELYEDGEVAGSVRVNWTSESLRLSVIRQDEAVTGPVKFRLY